MIELPGKFRLKFINLWAQTNPSCLKGFLNLFQLPVPYIRFGDRYHTNIPVAVYENFIG